MFFQSKLLRKGLIASYRAYARALFFLPGPPIFVNSVAKSGTHLLTKILENRPGTMMSGIHIPWWQCHAAPIAHGLTPEFELDRAAFARYLARAHPGQIVTSHFPWRPEIAETLRTAGYAIVFQMRDPRDTLVSQLRYILGLRRHFLHERMMSEFADDDARLMALITGTPPRGHDETAPIEPVGVLLAQRIGWLGQPDIHVCRFEDLVGARGGGDAEVQRREIRAVCAHVGRPINDADVDRLIDTLAKSKSFTFRRGVIGDWRNHFNAAHIAAFKEQGGQSLIDLGYERDLDW